MEVDEIEEKLNEEEEDVDEYKYEEEVDED
jgi:hypothetical protein